MTEFTETPIKPGKVSQYDPTRLNVVPGDGKYPGRISYPLGKGRAVVVSQDTPRAREVLEQWLRDREVANG